MRFLITLQKLLKGIKNRRLLLFIVDTLSFLAVYSFMLIATLIVDKTMYDEIFKIYLPNFLIFASFLITARYVGRVYSTLWRYANTTAYLCIVLIDTLAGVAALLVTFLIPGLFIGIWKSVCVVALFALLTLSIRFLHQWIYRKLNAFENDNSDRIKIAIIGAGQVGAILADELKVSVNSKYLPVCFIDTAKDKIGTFVAGLRVFDDSEETFEQLEKLNVKEFIVALPNIDEETVHRITEHYSRPGYSVKLYDVPLTDRFDENESNDKKRVIMDFNVEDLLFRSSNSKKILDDKTRDFYKDKIVLVTGGGGSIGSEICRQVAKLEPKKIIIFDIYENNAYDIQQYLVRKYGDKLDLSVEIGSVRDVDRLESVFDYYRPDVVFHAAAHKHVPLMEHSNCEAIKNNVLGTFNTANAAEKYGVKKFVLVSTDKAVNPTNVMGASKRMCEMVVQCRTDSNTCFAAVRFGNVLGSNGSVIPLFREQIKRGGPITLTDSRIIRYFMTIPEASKLVMTAGAMAKKGELFVLDMGRPVKIIDLAENMVRLSGFEPYKDIDIVEIGLRPGEKLYEELLIKGEQHEKTENNMIFIEKDTPLTRAEVDGKLDRLRAVVEKNKHQIASHEIIDVMKSVVPTYVDPEKLNATADKSKEMKMINNK